MAQHESLADALKACGAVLHRTGHHLVYLLPNGQKFATGKSPSDWRAERNALAVLRRVLQKPKRT